MPTPISQKSLWITPTPTQPGLHRKCDLCKHSSLFQGLHCAKRHFGSFFTEAVHPHRSELMAVEYYLHSNLFRLAT